MRNRIRYVLHPGDVRSANDGDIHFIGLSALERLYGLDRNEWVADNYRGLLPADVIHLYPRESGDYRLPPEVSG